MTSDTLDRGKNIVDVSSNAYSKHKLPFPYISINSFRLPTTDFSHSKVLITGANGQLGFDFRRILDSIGVEYIATDYKELDITQKDLVFDFIKSKGFDLIINCAAYNDVDKAEDDVNNCYKLNSFAPHYLSQAAKEVKATFITYSTDFVFDGSKNAPYTENDKPNPLSTYGKSKLEGENLVLEEYDRSIVIRTSWLFGINNKNFNIQVLNWAKNSKELKIVDDQVSSPTYSFDLAYFSLVLLEKNLFGLFHFSNDGVASKYDQALYLLNKIGWDGVIHRGKTSEFNLKAKRPSYSKLDSSKIEEIVGVKIPTWQSGIDRWWEEYNAF